MVAEKSPVVAENQHAHDVEPDRAVGNVEVFGEVGRRQPLEGVAIESFLGESLAAVLTELAADEDQVALLAGDKSMMSRRAPTPLRGFRNPCARDSS